MLILQEVNFMGLFDKFLNPLGHKFSKLSPSKKKHVAGIILIYGAACSAILERLINPLQGIINKKLNKSIKESLVDETLVAILKCCKMPTSESLGDYWKYEPELLRNILGAFVLFKDDASSTQTVTLEKSIYSCDPDEARTQLALKWKEILNIKDTTFILDVNEKILIKNWNTFTNIFIKGILTGFDRLTDDILFKKTKEELAELPQGRHAQIELFMKSLSSQQESHKPSKPKVTLAISGSDESDIFYVMHTTKPSPKPEDLLIVGQITKNANGKNEIKLFRGHNALTAVAISVAIKSEKLDSEDKARFSSWAGIDTSAWTSRHKGFFTRAFFLWFKKKYLGQKISGNETLAAAVSLLQEVEIPPFDKALTSDIENMCENISNIIYDGLVLAEMD